MDLLFDLRIAFAGSPSLAAPDPCHCAHPSEYSELGTMVTCPARVYYYCMHVARLFEVRNGIAESTTWHFVVRDFRG